MGLGLLAFGLTTLTGGIWTALVVVNLDAGPGFPWSVLPMAALLWALWQYLTGARGPRRTARTRRRLARITAPPASVFRWALLAGGLSLLALANLWIVLSRLVRIPRSPAHDLASYPVLTVVLLVAMASLVSAGVEEIAFRGYLQGPLEARVGRTAAVAITIAVIAPAHGITQGFSWPVVLFYLLTDAMLGALASLTDSVRPGLVIHAVGLAVFFTLVWPGDPTRPLVSAHPADVTFWIHAALVLTAAPAVLAFRRLRTAAAVHRPDTTPAEPTTSQLP